MKFHPFKLLTDADSISLEVESAKQVWMKMQLRGSSDLATAGVLSSGGFSDGIEQAGGTKGSPIRVAMAGVSSMYKLVLGMTKRPGAGAASQAKQLLGRAGGDAVRFVVEKPRKRRRRKGAEAEGGEQDDSADSVCLRASHDSNPRC